MKIGGEENVLELGRNAVIRVNLNQHSADRVMTLFSPYLHYIEVLTIPVTFKQLTSCLLACNNTDFVY